MEDTYSIKLKCKNCWAKDEFEIPKGKSIKEFTKETPCPKCGVKGRMRKSLIQFL